MLNSFLFFCRSNRSKASDILTKKGAGGVFAPTCTFLYYICIIMLRPITYKTHYFLMTTFLVLPFDLMIYTPLPEIWFT